MTLSSKHFFLVVVLLAGVASAQVATGTPPFGSFGGGSFDTVNLGNLNVHFAIPVVHKAGRGMPFGYDLSYDGSVWVPVSSNGVTQWQPVYNWGWRGSTEAQAGYMSYSTGSNICYYTVGGIKYVGSTDLWQTNYVYHDAWGVAHSFAGTSNVWTGNGNGGCYLGTNNSVTATTTDGSGYTLYANFATNTTTITSRGGKAITPPTGGGSGSATSTDSNGNQITVSSSGVFTDTLGTTVLTVSGIAPNPTTFTYTAPSGSQAYTMNYVQYTVQTAFGVTGINEYGPLENALVDNIQLPDGSKYSFIYEAGPSSCVLKPGTTHCITGRIKQITLPTGGTIVYAYVGGTNGTGIESDGSTAGLTRTLDGGEWQYARSLSGSTWTTVVTDPTTSQNQTAISFMKDSGSGSGVTNNFYETQRLVYSGSTSGTLLSTTITCYNGNSVSSPSNCYNTAVASPILRTTVFKYLPNASGLQAETDNTINNFGLINEVDEYGYGAGAVGSIIRKTVTAYTGGMSGGIVDRPASVSIEDAVNSVWSSTSYGYDAGTPTPTPVCPATGCSPQHISISGSRGLLTSVAAKVSGSITLYRTYTYYDTGTLSTSTDVSTSSTTPGAQTTYNYSFTNNADCGNAFVTSITEPLSLSRSMTWDCNGGVMLSLTDENTKTSSTAYSGSNYTNYFWRPYSTTDQAGNTTNYFYYLNSSNQPFQTESKSATFNSGNSIVDTLTTNDGFGRTIFHQTKQGPSASNYDTVATCYDNEGRVNFTSLPYSAAAITSGATCPTGNAGTSTTYDALNRVFTVSDSGGGSTTYTYTENDVLQTLTSPTQSKQQEYDALGRLTSVCEITSGTTQFPGASCNQNTAATGYLTQYSYDVMGDLTNVTQNAQAGSGQQQTRAYYYDLLGRLLKETNPETNNAGVYYAYDALTSDASCGTITSAGNMLKRLDAAGNATCYAGYDALHRVGNIVYPSTGTPAKYFVYDAATVNGTAMTNAKTRLARAYTCISSCSSKITDLGFSYLSTGQTSDVWESTPYSGTYYHVTSTPWPNGAPNTLSNLTGLPTITYLTDGEGRSSTVSDSNGQNPISAITLNAASQATAITLGSSDTDSFTFDPNTGRLTQYQFSVGSSPKTDTGVLHWNPNGSLLDLVITDQINTTNSQSCSYTHDALGRVTSANCGCSLWSQNFSYDPFGNITKTIAQGCTAMSFQPSYDYTNYTNRITSTPFTYNNNNGDMTADNNHAYGWDTENKLTGIDTGTSSGACIVYDALGRAVEEDKGSACATSPTSSTEIVYSPSGAKLALMNGSTLVKGFVSLPGGVQAVYNSSGLQYYRHPDWLGSSRLATTTSRTSYYDVAYAPFGEPYAGSGTQDLSFTGQNQDTESSTVPGGAGGLYDFLYREHTPVQGRWLSPDPSGLAAVNPADPQSWNRYAYVGNRPLNSVDALGLFDPVCGLFCPVPCDPSIEPGCTPAGGGGGGEPGGAGGGGGGGGGGHGGGGGGGQPAPPTFAGGVWPGNDTPGLPSGLNTSPLMSLASLLGLLPGIDCGGMGGGSGFTTTTASNNPCPPNFGEVPVADAPNKVPKVHDDSGQCTRTWGFSNGDCPDNPGWTTDAVALCQGNGKNGDNTEVQCCADKMADWGDWCASRSSNPTRPDDASYRFKYVPDTFLTYRKGTCCKKRL
jgi:RHS repeat-associated protein